MGIDNDSPRNYEAVYLDGLHYTPGEGWYVVDQETQDYVAFIGSDGRGDKDAEYDAERIARLLNASEL